MHEIYSFCNTKLQFTGRYVSRLSLIHIWDLSENFEYKAAKQDKNRNESRIRYLERMLKTANIVSDDSKEDEIGINNTVDLYFEDDEEVETCLLYTSNQ